LLGNCEALKERVIGQAVFDRDAGYDTNQDAVVRNAAAEVRKRLAQYYLEAGLDTQEVRIELPSGTYVPEFHQRLVDKASEPPPASGVKRRIRGLDLLLALIAVTCLSGWLLTARSGSQTAITELDRFWGPLLAAQAPIQICVGQSRLYYVPEHLPESRPDLTISMTQLQPMRDRFLWYGDSVSMAEITAYFALHHKSYRFRGAMVTPYAELLGNPVVLIGAFNNDWTMRLTQGLRFSLVNGDTPEVRGVRDREKGSGLVWHLTKSLREGSMADEDYALVSRFLDPQTQQVIVVAAGITHLGTMAAGNFLSSSAFFREAVRSAPADWYKKNIQIVLQTKVVEGTPGPPLIWATHFW
jgi:hypothetical protein